MAYEPNPEWKPGEAGGTPITDAKLNRLEGGVAAVSRVADGAALRVEQVAGQLPVVASGDDSNLAAALASVPASAQVVFVMIAGT